MKVANFTDTHRILKIHKLKIKYKITKSEFDCLAAGKTSRTTQSHKAQVFVYIISYVSEKIKTKLCTIMYTNF